ncbi:DUF1990 family protein [Deinococcus pimensis]|uniref:DUF1990 family protein n=1 Tax=Deinococcus pimensis TaxID=309888 RepID=UPI0004B42E06|nr:DUF1990 domain-containing protein [Deinococcus pimensis]
MPLRLSLRSPSPPERARALEAAHAASLTYPEPCATRGLVPAGYRLDVTAAALGEGRATFERARDLLRVWTPFDQPWLTLHGADAPPFEGQVLLLHARVAGLHSLNVCRVVYVEDAPRVCAFAYGTLDPHAARGEERFEVRLHDDDAVTFRIKAFSRPNGLLARLGFVPMRLLQRRFARLAVRAMRTRCG